MWVGPLAHPDLRAYPIREERSLLGRVAIAAAYVHWFGAGDSAGTPGALFAVDIQTGFDD